MANERKNKRKRHGKFFLLVLLAGIIVCLYLVLYRPDRPVANIVPGSSSGPAFVVQVIRPRMGLPLGGIIPPQFFGVDANLGFDSSTPGATVDGVALSRIELSSDEWELVIVLDSDGRVAPETHVVFEFEFENRLRRVRCWPNNPAVGTFDTTVLAESDELSGNFDIELGRCEDAFTGEPLGWPPKPLILHGSFDRLPLDRGKDKPRADSAK